MILLDGKAAAQKILDGLKEQAAALSKRPRLAIVVVGKDPVVDTFISQKKKAADGIGVDMRVYPFPTEITTNELRKRIAEIVHEKRNTGVIIQLPLPPHINKQYILNAIPAEKDPDVLSGRAIGNFAVGKSPVMPPVAGAIQKLFEEYKIDYRAKSIAIVGAGALVGRPVALWLMTEGVGFTLITENTAYPEAALREADIVISGIGKPRSITEDQIKKGAIIIDAGTSESAGEIVGDVDADSVSAKASVLTPVPGGIGPLTVAILFKNLMTLAQA
ncbi:MAG: bifunctional 5,10-methylenetetrahydrofolate dehydrogenase/5,10-methenyltetrahydrofolate cyclohydrolase [Patescibacteria group bacterium]